MASAANPNPNPNPNPNQVASAATTARATSEVAARAPWLGGVAEQILLAAQSAEQRRGGGAWRVVGWQSAVLTSGAADRARLMHAWAQAPVFDEGKGRQKHT